MFRTSDTVLIGLMVAAAAFTYQTKHDAEDRLREVRKLERAIAFEQDTITILKADWSLLTQPERLQRLAENFQDELQLVPSDPRRIVGLDALPVREVNIEDLIAGDGGAHVKDSITTGSVSE